MERGSTHLVSPLQHIQGSSSELRLFKLQGMDFVSITPNDSFRRQFKYKGHGFPSTLKHHIMYSNSSAPFSYRLPANVRDSRRSTLSQGEYGRSSSASVHGSQWTEHHYTLSDARDPPWATLMVRSRASSPSHLPSTFEGENITGTISLNLAREDSIKAVVVSVSCSVASSYRGNETDLTPPSDYRPNNNFGYKCVSIPHTLAGSLVG